jgi:hypothetical protein
MTRITMSTLNLCSGNQCEWMSLFPLWLALSCLTLQLDLATSPPHPARPCSIPTSCSMFTWPSAQKTGPELRGKRLRTNTSVACCEHEPPFPQFLSGENLSLSSGTALSPDHNLWAFFFERDLEAGTPVQASDFVVGSGESPPEPSLHPEPPPSNGLKAHGCPSGPGHRCVVGPGASGAVCGHFPTAWPSYSWCGPTPGPRGAEALGHQCYRTPETHLAPVAGRLC